MSYLELIAVIEELIESGNVSQFDKVDWEKLQITSEETRK